MTLDILKTSQVQSYWWLHLIMQDQREFLAYPPGGLQLSPSSLSPGTSGRT